MGKLTDHFIEELQQQDMKDKKFFEVLREKLERPPFDLNRNPPPRRRRKPVPIYEYKCDKCGDRFEVFVSMGCRESQTCPSCGHGKSTKLVSSAGFVLKGGGWYKDGYQKGGDK
jgi:putative FmdB family regulatory protein